MEDKEVIHILQAVVFTCLVVASLYLSTKVPRKIQVLEMVGYFVVLIYVTLFLREIGAHGQYSFLPLQEVVFWMPRYYKAYGFWAMFRPIGGLYLNILLFVPFGWFAAEKYDLKRVLLLGFLFSLTIEIIQLITGLGMFETDDLITNTLGTYIGYRYAKGIKYGTRSRQENKKRTG